MNKETGPVGRFAPTPSGRMHLGNALCSLIAWLSVRRAGGRMILRVEDLDTERSNFTFSREIEQELRWLGLDWDEGGTDADGHRYCQSHRTEIYDVYFEKLREQGLLYPCFCSRAELHAASAPHRSDGRFIYEGRCRNLTPEQIEEKSHVRLPAWRVRVPDREIRFVDLHYGEYVENLVQDCGDFVVRRADGVYAYQLAVSVDDARMGVTEVVRGNDLLSSSPRQIWLHELFGFPVPRYGHIPLLLAPDGRRLSKRDGDIDIETLSTKFAPEEIIGMLAFSSGLIEKYEPVKAQELIETFSWEKIRREDVCLPQMIFER